MTTAASAGVLPLTLADAIERGLAHNLGLMAVEQQVESARGSRLRTLRELLPRVDARAGDTRQTSNLAAFGFDSALFPGIPSIVGPYTIFDARVYASQPVLDLSARSDLRSKNAALQAMRFESENAHDVVTYVVTTLYFQAAAGESRIEAARSQVSTAQALLTQATNLRNAGVAPGIDVVRAQVQVQAQKQRLILAENEFAKQTLQLVRAIGIPTAQAVRLADRALPSSGDTTTVEAALARAASGRADYKASLERVRAAESALRATRQDALPTLQVNADVGVIGSNPGNARRTYAMAVGVRVPLFDVDRNGRAIENMAALKQRQAEAADLQQRIEADVRSACLDVNAAERSRAVARERVSLANQELSLARIRFTAGVTSNLEVTQAQNEVAVASENEVAATFSLNVAQAALARAIGE
ncbi:MAG: TolC family protein [Vicinamibacterales bacterium]